MCHKTRIAKGPHVFANDGFLDGHFGCVDVICVYMYFIFCDTCRDNFCVYVKNNIP